MAHAYRRISLQQHHRQRFTYNVTARNDDGSPACKLSICALEHLHHRSRSRGQKTRQAQEEITRAARTDTIDLFTRDHRIRHHCTTIQDFCRHALSPTIAVTRCLPSEMRASAPLRRFPKPATSSSFFIARKLNLTSRAAPSPAPEASIAPIATSLNTAALPISAIRWQH